MTVKDLQEKLENLIKYNALSPDAKILIEIGTQQQWNISILNGQNHTLKLRAPSYYESY